MSYYRSYFEKNNTIIENSLINTAKNPATEIFYGDGFSKFIFKVDFTELLAKVNDGDYVLDNNTTHTLNLTNTIFGDETFLGAKRGTGRDRAASFDLILFKISEDWDEGVGFDYENTTYDYGITRVLNSTAPSNWTYATTLSGWTIEGIYSTAPDIIDTIHFDNGDENIQVDITSYVNDILSGETNYGLGLAFSVAYQDIVLDTDQSVAFFTKYTQTFFEPYVETHFSDRIDDDRYDFQERRLQNLYLYVFKDTNYYDLDNIPTVDIYDSTNTLISTLSGLTATKVRKGVYKVTFGLTGLNCDGKRFFYDKWSNISLDAYALDDVTQKFIPMPYADGFQIGAAHTDVNRFAVKFFGIKQNEKISRGDVRKLSVSFISVDGNENTLIEKAYYRLYVKEGKREVIVHDWTQMDRTVENSIMLDTSYLIPREYYVELKATLHSEVIHYEKPIKFEIVSER